jgi:molybdopterin molybdotransferase
LNAGHVVRPIDVGLLCEVGHTQVDVTGPVHVAVLATGNELVPAEQVPGAGMIRNSNGPMLCALARDQLCQVADLGICGDEIGALQRSIRRGLGNDVLLLSGGVSAGVLDLVPKVLEELGVERVFHKVYLKPGKPLWFGVCHAGSSRTLVFGLPGNPVGCLVCFELFVSPALRKLRGLGTVAPAIRSATLSDGYRHRSDRPTYVPAVASHLEDHRLVAAPLAWAGSADQRAVGEANCLVLFPAGERVFAAGDQVALLLLGPIPPVS